MGTGNSEDESNDTRSEDETSDRNVVAKPRKDIAKRSSKHASVLHAFRSHKLH